MTKNDDKKNTLLTHVPIFKPFVLDGYNLIQKLPYSEPKEYISRVDNDPRLEERTFRFATSSISKLKDRANSELGPDPGLGKISSFRALVALVWISINRARKVPAEAMSNCLIAIDCRARLRPPLSPDHFGNLAQGLTMTKNVGELLENGFGSACAMLHKGIVGYDDQVSTCYLKAALENPQVLRVDDFNNSTNINFVTFSWGSRFDIYRVDFGLGKPVASQSGNIDKREGSVIVLAGRAGRGSIDLEMALFPESLIALESDFNQHCVAHLLRPCHSQAEEPYTSNFLNEGAAYSPDWNPVW